MSIVAWCVVCGGMVVSTESYESDPDPRFHRAITHKPACSQVWNASKTPLSGPYGPEFTEAGAVA